MFNWFKTIRRSHFRIRLSHWEYWPFAAVYFPIYPVWLWFAARSRSLFFFGSANPGITNSGFLMESKQEIYDYFPKHLMPHTFRIHPGISTQEVLQLCLMAGIGFPVILKPDIGMQGIAVCKVEDEESLQRIVEKISIPFIVQPFVEFPNEIGVFYIKLPGQKEGIITGVVKKEFVAVAGDGEHTIRELLLASDRYRLQLPALEISMGEKLDRVLPSKVEEILVPFGNHARGALFLDVTEVFAPVIEQTITDAMSQVPDFHYGRLDIRYNSLEEMHHNKNWTIIELNGAGSEPTHMYDPSHSLLFAWKEIIRHWHYLFQVSIINRRLGRPGISFKQGLQMYSAHKAYQKLLKDNKSIQHIGPSIREMITPELAA
jgi:hypothetical protein